MKLFAEKQQRNLVNHLNIRGLMARQAYRYIKLGVVGSRDFKHLDLVRLTIQQFGPCVIISGGAIGVDSTAADEAKKLGYPAPIIFLPEWKKYGRAAGMIRNKLIVEASDGLVIFWDGHSKGTANTLATTKKAKKQIILVTEEGEEVKSVSIGWNKCLKF